MHPVMLGVALSLLGLKVGWVPANSGGMCYIIQLDPHDVDVFKREQRIQSELPRGLQDVRAFRIEIGTTDPPQQPSREELVRKLEQAKLQKASPDKFGGPRGDLGDPRWSAESTKSALDTATPPSAKEPSETAKKPATPSSPLRPGISYQPIRPPPPTGNAKTEASKAEAKQPEAKKPESVTGLALALLGSLGGNCFLMWIVWESRVRCRALLRRRYGAEPLDAGATG